MRLPELGTDSSLQRHFARHPFAAYGYRRRRPASDLSFEVCSGWQLRASSTNFCAAEQLDAKHAVRKQESCYRRVAR